MENSNFFAADTTVFQIVSMGGSTRRLWKGANFQDVEIMVVPMNITTRHWTLLAVDVKRKRRLYFDPLHSKERRINGNDRLCTLIDNISQLIDLKTGWKCTEWPCVEPLHYQQEDGYNCGVIICLFARRLAEGLDCNRKFSMRVERERMACTLLGSCYSDMMRRNANVCKICRDDDGEDWVGCDGCAQYFHANCLGVSYSEVLSQPFFFCPH